MPYIVPSLEKLITDLETSYYASISVQELPLDEQSARSRQFAYALNALYDYLTYISKQIIPTTSEGVFLEAHCASKKIFRKLVVYASGLICVKAAAGTLIPAGTIYKRSDGVCYEVLQDAIISTNPQNISVQCQTSGSIGNCVAGTELQLTVSLAGVENTAKVQTMGAGADRETDADLLARYLVYMENLYYGGADSDYKKWALSIAGVNRAWVEGCAMGAGTVTVRIMTPTGLPDDVLLKKVWDYIETIRPVTARRIFVVAPNIKYVDIPISGLEPNTTDMRDKVESVITDIFNKITDLGATVKLIDLNADLTLIPGINDFHIDLDANITAQNNEILVLRSVQWTL